MHHTLITPPNVSLVRRPRTSSAAAAGAAEYPVKMVGSDGTVNSGVTPGVLVVGRRRLLAVVVAGFVGMGADILREQGLT